MEKETPVQHQLYAVTLMANRVYPHYAQSSVTTLFTIIPEKYKDSIRDDCMEMCYKHFPVKDGYTEHTVNYCLIPREFTTLTPSGDNLHYRIHIVGVDNN